MVATGAITEVAGPTSDANKVSALPTGANTVEAMLVIGEITAFTDGPVEITVWGTEARVEIPGAALPLGAAKEVMPGVTGITLVGTGADRMETG